MRVYKVCCITCVFALSFVYSLKVRVLYTSAYKATSSGNPVSLPPPTSIIENSRFSETASLRMRSKVQLTFQNGSTYQLQRNKTVVPWTISDNVSEQTIEQYFLLSVQKCLPSGSENWLRNRFFVLLF